MKTLCLLGSPRRHGNSDSLAHRFMENASRHQASTETVTLSSLSYSGCINLYQCKNGSSRCGQTDDLTAVLESIEQAQVLVLASPIYFTNVSGQLKLAIDRMFSFFVPDYPVVEVKSRLTGNRHLVFIQTQGEPEDRYTHILDDYSAGFNGLGYQHLHLIRAWGVREPGDVELNPDILLQCDTLAQAIYGSSVRE